MRLARPWTWAALAGVAVVAACKKDVPAPAVAPSASAPVAATAAEAPSAAAAATAAASAAPSAATATVTVEEDFEKSAREAIHEDNIEDQVSALEREINKK